MDKEYNKLFRQYFIPVKSFIKKLVKSDDDAEDLAQDVFTQLWTKPDIWQNNTEIDRYIYRMAKYQALTSSATMPGNMTGGSSMPTSHKSKP